MPQAIEYTCPLGHTCEEIRDNKIHRCMWYLNIKGENPVTGEQCDDWQCSMIWNNIQLIELSKAARRNSAAIESFRNEMMKGNEKALQIMYANSLLLGNDDGK